MVDTMAAAGKAPPSSSAPALDELMLAMDVVDTLRHDESVALRELEQDGRDDSLRQRLRSLYEGQGLEVSDRILDEGIRALRESRFTYTPTSPGLKRMLAGLWIRRGLFAKAIALILLLIIGWASWSVWQDQRSQQAANAARIELTETLPRQIEAAAQNALSEAKTADARERAEQLHGDAVSALARSDTAAARVGVAALDRLAAELRQTYVLRVVSRTGTQSGLYRIPDINTGARNYYLVVDALKADGSPLTLPIINEETGQTKNLSTWAVRVPKQTYDAVARDKMDDGIIQNNILAEKQRGALEPAYRMPVSGGAITDW